MAGAGFGADRSLRISCFDPFCRRADKAHALFQKVGPAAHRVQHKAVAGGIKRIHGEIAPCGIAGDISAKGDLCVAAIGFHVMAKGCDLVWHALRQDGDGAMFETRWDRAQACRLASGNHLFGQGIGGQINVPDAAPECCVAHSAADHEHQIARGFQDIEHLLGFVREIEGNFHG